MQMDKSSAEKRHKSCIESRIVTGSRRKQAAYDRIAAMDTNRMNSFHQGGNSTSHTHSATPIRGLTPSPGMNISDIVLYKLAK